MDNLKTHVHSNGLPTEIAAFTKASYKSNSIKLQILVSLKEVAEMGLTPDEFVAKNGGLINTIRRRFTDLWKEGKIKHHPNLLARKNFAGNDCVTWVLGRDIDLPPWKPKRKWVGLTDEELLELSKDAWGRSNFGRAVEAKLKEKNT
jgi:hypothetical protein